MGSDCISSWSLLIFLLYTWIKSRDILVLYCIALSRWCLSHSSIWKWSRLLFIQQKNNVHLKHYDHIRFGKEKVKVYCNDKAGWYKKIFSSPRPNPSRIQRKRPKTEKRQQQNYNKKNESKMNCDRHLDRWVTDLWGSTTGIRMSNNLRPLAP